MYITEICFCWDVFMHCCLTLQNGCEWARNVLQKIQENLWPFCAAAFRHSFFSVFVCKHWTGSFIFQMNISDSGFQLIYYFYCDLNCFWSNTMAGYRDTGKLYRKDKANISNTLGNDTDFLSLVFLYLSMVK